MKHKVIFQPSGRRGEVEEGKNLLDVARELGVDIESVCGGKRTCGKCKVRIEEGFFSREAINSALSNVSPIGPDEVKFIKAEDGDNTRLACKATILGDILVFVPEKSRAGKQIVRKAATERAIELNPALCKYYVELQPASLHDPQADFERLVQALQETYGLDNLTIDYTTLQELQPAIRQCNWNVTATIWMGKEIVRVEPGFVEECLGLAVDVGTTTVAAYLSDLRSGRVLATDSMMNPQVTYGEDVMSRITYTMTQPDGLNKMHRAIIDGLSQIARNVTQEIQRAPEDICEVVIVGNTAMHHVFLNISPEQLGFSPFPPAVQKSVDVKARDLGLEVNRAAYVHVLPNEAGFVGADNVGVLIAEEPYNQDSMMLIIDIGTNGELVLGNRNKMISSSCATGPAFEGAHIKFGMRAAPGAIEKVRIDPETLEPQYKVIGKTDWHSHYTEVGAKGICGSGIIDAAAEMFKAGIVLKSGRFNMNLISRRVRQGHDGLPEYVLAWAEETSIGADITVNQSDIRALQLAKGALYAGAKVMMQKLGITKPDKVVLAGAFGSYIDKEQAMVIGLFPSCEPENVYAVGNAAGDGARIALLNTAKRAEANDIAGKVEYVELTVEPTFEKEFMWAMHFPHMKDEFPYLKHILETIPKDHVGKM